MSIPKTNDPFYLFCVVWLRMFFSLCYRLRIRGNRQIPPRGGCIIATNHLSYLDPVILSVASPRILCFMAKQELFKGNFFDWLIRNLNAFPVKRESADSKALLQAVELLRAGRALIVFPEGTRSKDGTLGPAEPGISLLAARADVPVVPGMIRGTNEAMPIGEKDFFMGKRISVSFGKPLYFRESGFPRNRVGMQQFSELIMASIRQLDTERAAGISSATPDSSAV